MARHDDWLRSAEKNFASILGRKRRSNPCSLIGHYTDVAAEATAAEALAAEAGVNGVATRASKLASTATRAQRGAVEACRRGIIPMVQKPLSGARRRRR